MLIRRLPSLPNWTSSFRELDEARREMERLFDSLSGVTAPWTAGVFPPWVEILDVATTIQRRPSSWREASDATRSAAAAASGSCSG